MIHRIWPHIVAYLIMMAAAFALFHPYFDGKVLAQPDNQRARAMQTEMMSYEKIDGHTPLWTNSMFSGMPTYMIRHTAFGSAYFHVLWATLWWQDITMPHFILLLAMVMAYLALIVFKVDWRIAVLGGISYGISTYFVDLAEAGHSTKMLAMAFTPGIWGAAVLILRKHWFLGTGLFALLTSLQILANHLQITYYTFLLLGIGLLIMGYHAWRALELRPFLTGIGCLALGLGISVASNTSLLWPTYEYTKETIRGTSELSSKAEKGSGLDKEYAFSWSYGIGESMTLLIPNFFGGGASQTFAGTDTYKRAYPMVMNNYLQQGMSRNKAAKAAEQQVAAIFYHGNQPFVGVAIYFGAALILLFVLGAFIVQGPMRWWLLSGALGALAIAWGKHFFLNDLLFNYFPFFNKFRAVSMALGLSHLCVALLAMMGLQAFLTTTDRSKLTRPLTLATLITGGITLLGILAGMMMDVTGPNDGSIGTELASIVQKDRVSILRADGLRSLFFILATAGFLWMWLKGKINASLSLGAIALLVIVDVWMVDMRILFPGKYESAAEANAIPEPTRADNQIMDDTDPHFRVLDLRGHPYTNASTSFYHKSVGGYHAAKLMRYQELIDAYLMNPSENMTIFGMLNTKYIIQEQEGQSVVIPMREAFGNAWFVQKLRAVVDADTELANLKATSLRSEAVVQGKLIPDLWGSDYTTDTAAQVRLTKYHPDTMTYRYSSAQDAFIVFSEIYYPPSKGWKVYLDGQPYDDFIKVNYLLRGLKVPAGTEKEIMMVFHPESVFTGKKIAMAGSWIGLLILLGGIGLYFRNRSLPELFLLPKATPPTRAASPVKKSKKA